MGAPFCYVLKGNHCWLSPERMIYWEEQRALVVSDLHFGKTGHFRKEGIAVPQSVYKEDLQRLVSQLQFFQPHRLIVVGDMFHSAANRELEWFTRWRHDFSALEIHLIMGNHDILHQQWYEAAGILIDRDTLLMEHFLFMHDVTGAVGAGGNMPYVFSGHMHPGVRLNGMARQSLQFPCFYFTPEFAVLPAFSRFTGQALVKPKAGDQVFAIVNQTIIPL